MTTSNKQTLSNGNIQVAIDRDTGLFEVFDEHGGALWGPDPWENNPGLISLREQTSDRVVHVRLCDSRQITVKPVNGDDHAVRLEFTGLAPSGASANCNVSIELTLSKDKPELSVCVGEIEVQSPWEFVDLVYPLRSLSLRSDREEGYLALPFMQGCIVPCKLIQSDYRAQYQPGTVGLNLRIPYHTTYSIGAGLTMPWYGSKYRDNAFVCVLETPDDAELEFHNQWAGDQAQYFRILGASPAWRASMGQLRYPRIARYSFLKGGDYVAMAKAYREHAIKSGDYKSLRQKIEENPNVERAIGASFISFQQVGFPEKSYDWAGLEEVVRDLRESGVKKAALNVFTNKLNLNGVYDYTPGGNLQDMRRVCELVESYGYIFTPYDEYFLVYEDAPGWDGPGIAIKDAKGQAARGAAFNPGTRGYLACTSSFPGRFRAKLATTERLLGQVSGRFIDTCGCSPLRECHDPDHPMTRTEDWQYRAQALEDMHRRGIVVSTEGGKSWATRACTFLCGVNGTNYGVPAPLFSLVFHDAVISQWHPIWGYNVMNTIPLGAPQPMMQCAESSYGLVFATKFLRDLLYGTTPIFGFFSHAEYWDRRDLVKQASDVLGSLHEKIGLDDMVYHRFLTEDMLVQETGFSSGVEVRVNFGMTQFRDAAGIETPALGYRVRGPELTVDGKFQLEHKFARS